MKTLKHNLRSTGWRFTATLLLYGLTVSQVRPQPFAATQPAMPVTDVGAALGGMAVPNGLPTSAWFEWGTSAVFGNATSQQDVGDGVTVVRITASIGDLAPGFIYHYRLVASNATGVAYGAPHTLVTGGKVVAWGASDWGQTNVPPGLQGVVSVASGEEHSVALQTNGQIVAWGRGTYGETNIPKDLTNAMAVLCGHTHSVALTKDGGVRGWGNDDYDALSIPLTLSNLVMIGGCGQHHLALKLDGTIAAWGRNDMGQTDVPSGLSNVVAVAGGTYHSLALKADGSLVAWGGGSDWGVTTNFPPDLTNVVAIESSYAHSLALTADGTVRAWGCNNEGQTNVPGWLTNAVAVAATYSNSMALTAEGGLATWGASTNPPPGLSRVVGLAGGAGHCVAVGVTPLPPEASTKRVTQKTPVSARLNGQVTPHGLETVGWFEWGETPSYGNTAGITNVLGGGSAVAVTAEVTGLTEGITYHFRVAATNSLGAAYGQDFSFAAGFPGTNSDLISLTASLGSFSPLFDPAVTNYIATIPGLLASTTLTATCADTNAVLQVRLNGGPFGQLGTGVESTSLDLEIGTNTIDIRVTAENGAQARTYSLLVVRLPLIPTITAEPTNQNAHAGASVSFSVLATGCEPLHYQWFKNASLLLEEERISGSQTPLLTISYLLGTDTGPYSVSISNVYGSVTSRLATLVVADPFIAVPPQSQTAYDGTEVTFTIDVLGTTPISYQWQFRGIDIPGATNSSLALTNVQYSGAYSVVVSNAVGITNSPAATLNVLARSPVLTLQPTNQVVLLGTSEMRLVGAASGYGSLRYQWRFNGADLADGGAVSGANSPTLVLSHPGFLQVGDYCLVVTNAYGAAKTRNATIDVRQINLWAKNNDQGQRQIPAGLRDVVALAASSYHVLALRSNGMVAAWGSPAHGQSVVPLGLNNVVAVAAGEYHSLALQADGTVVAWGAGTNRTSYSNPHYRQSVVPTNLGTVKAIAAGGYTSAAVRTNGTVVVWGYNASGQTNVPAGLSNVVAVAVGGAHVLALKSDGTLTAWGSNDSGQRNTAGISNVLAIAAGSAHNLALRYDGTVTNWGGNVTKPPSTNNHDVAAIAAGGSRCMILNTTGTQYSWGSYGFVPGGLGIAIAASDGIAVAALGDGSVVVLRQPLSQMTYVSDAASFRIATCYAAPDDYPLRYQWQFNGANIPGATQSCLSLTNLQFSNVGTYRALLATNYGPDTPVYSITSAPAKLSLRTFSTTTNLGLAAGATGLVWKTTGNASWYGQTNLTHDGVDAVQSGPVTNYQKSVLTAEVVGPGTLSFWWKVSSEKWFDTLSIAVGGTQMAAISGEVDWEPRTCRIPSGSNVVTWTYLKDVSLSDGIDAAWLDDVHFTPDPPVIDQQPLSQVASFGDTVSLTVIASGKGPLGYQWLMAGTNLPGATSWTLTLTKVGGKDAAEYSVRVTNEGGSILSSNALLTVRVPQQLTDAALQPDGGFRLLSANADGGAAPERDLWRFAAQASTDLVDWITLTNVLSFTNGALLLVDTNAVNYRARYYRLLEQ